MKVARRSSVGRVDERGEGMTGREAGDAGERERGLERREFIRHPTSIPIAVSVDPVRGGRLRPLRDLSHGGLSFSTPSSMRRGSTVSIRIQVLDPAVTLVGRVAWCQAAERGYDVGVRFMGGDTAYRVRMIEQVCHIEDYRRRARVSEGRELSAQQAAVEWIAKHAASFPGASVAS